MIVVNPTMGGGLSGAKLALANAASADVLSGKKFYSQDKTLKTGTRPKGTLRMVTGTFEAFDTVSNSDGSKKTKTINVGFKPSYLIFEARNSSAAQFDITPLANRKEQKMQTLIIHDQDGNVILTQSGSFTMPESVGMAVADVPAGQTVDFVNVATGEVILKELPKSETEQRLDSMEAALAALVGGEGHE